MTRQKQIRTRHDLAVKKQREAAPKALAGFDVAAALRAGNRREQAGIDGTTASLPAITPALIQRIARHCRDELYRACDGDSRRLAALLKEREGIHEEFRAVTPLLPQYRLPLTILNEIRAVMPQAVGDDYFLAQVMGKDALARKRARSAGGSATAQLTKERADAEHAAWCKEARRLLASGRQPREISGIIARQPRGNGRTVRTIREALQRAGLLPRKGK